MAIESEDYETRLSGGSSNSNEDASLGGVKSSTEASTSVNGLFDPVSAAEALAGDINYRCVYLHNGNATDLMENCTVHISENTPLAGTTIEIGVGTAAINGTEQTIEDEEEAPDGVTFSAPSSQGAALALGSIPAGQHKAIWIRRTVTAGSNSSPNDTFELEYNSETA